jgi:hypothetical protein
MMVGPSESISTDRLQTAQRSCFFQGDGFERLWKRQYLKLSGVIQGDERRFDCK